MRFPKLTTFQLKLLFVFAAALFPWLVLAVAMVLGWLASWMGGGLFILTGSSIITSVWVAVEVGLFSKETDDNE